MDAAYVSLYCPPMPVTRVGFRLRRTAAEPMQATISFQSQEGMIVNISRVVIPPTFVRWQNWLSWAVDACEGDGAENGYRLLDKLPVEPVLLEGFSMVAKAMDTDCTLWTPDGRVFRGSMHYPDCPTNIFTGIAPAVTAKGKLTLA